MATFHPLKVSFYELVVKQLQDDGFHDVADQLMSRTDISQGNSGEDGLFSIYKDYIGKLEENKKPYKKFVATPTPPLGPNEERLDFSQIKRRDEPPPVEGEDGIFPSTSLVASKALFQTTHKGAVRTVSFSPDGRFVVTGSADCSVKVLECSKMRQVGLMESQTGREDMTMRSVVRSFFDHQGAVVAAQFHPSKPVLLTGSYDKCVKIWDLAKRASQIKPQGVLQDLHPVRCMEVHPCGDFLYVGTSHSAIRVYDLATLNCFTSMNMDDHHTGPVNDIKATSDGKIVASAGRDGAIKLWDAVSNHVINTLDRAHGGAPVTSIRWSRDLRCFLSAGNDGRCRLWDSRMGDVLYTCGIGPRTSEYTRAVFCWNERYIAIANNNNQVTDVCLVDSTTGSPLTARLNGHEGASVLAVDGSTFENCIVTGADDNKVRYLELERTG